MKFKAELLLSVGAAGIVASIFSGCATTSQETVGTTVSIPVHFAKDVISGAPVVQSEVENAVALAAKTNTRFPYQQQWGGQFYMFRGLYTAHASEGLTITYARGDTNGSRGGGQLQLMKYQSKVSFSIHVDSVTDNSSIVSFGPEVSITHGTNAIAIPYPELAPTPVLVADLRNILSHPSQIIVHRTSPVQGEINVAFNSESTYANFMRKLGKYQFRGDEPKTNDMEKMGAYNIQVGPKVVPLYVDVMPYRNGSKVIYKMNIPYELSGDGAQSVTMNDINEAKRKIAAVAND